ncbi:unnamed protein product [Ranitomeya imitator]|uniref:EGF-like domain-containing protein n=1 Tax=Ranitomeya imitator TaxID=111125 RepID=A0ABN9LKT8_9NEOB|nr:unnamed protein product [Ranitomeya imitator]
MTEVGHILRWAEENRSMISAVHIPGVENWEADFLSRQGLDSGEWSVHPEIFHQICCRWGTPDVDLMASQLNSKVPYFIAQSHDPAAIGADALVHSWHQFRLPYIFPPLPLLPRVIKIRAEGIPVILIAPDWPHRAWYAELVQLVADVPWRLPNRADLLSQGPIYHQNSEALCTFEYFVNVISARTAVGHDKDGRLILFHVDGQTGDRGMSLWEVADFLKQQGVINAINLDGGGSATLVTNGSLASYPSDHCSDNPMWRCPRSVSTVVCVHEPFCDPPDCRGHGQCVAGACHCTEYWTGSFCEVLICGASNCSSRGTCTPGGCVCDSGWMDKNCSSACNSGYYGDGCTSVCRCQNNGTCDHVNGTCDCPAGFTGLSCEEVCPFGFYGVGCQKVCRCEKQCYCHPATGDCSFTSEPRALELLSEVGTCMVSVLHTSWWNAVPSDAKVTYLAERLVRGSHKYAIFILRYMDSVTGEIGPQKLLSNVCPEYADTPYVKGGTSQISDLTVCTALCQITDLTCSAAAFTVPALSRLCEATSLPAGPGSAAILDPGLEGAGREVRPSQQRDHIALLRGSQGSPQGAPSLRGASLHRRHIAIIFDCGVPGVNVPGAVRDRSWHIVPDVSCGKQLTPGPRSPRERGRSAMTYYPVQGQISPGHLDGIVRLRSQRG